MRPGSSRRPAAADPWGGSFYVERLTQDLANKAWAHIQEVEELGGMSKAIEAGQASFAEAGGPRAYFGWPADATAEEGRETIGILGGILSDAALEVLEPA